MAAKDGRHARTKGADWGTNPSRSDEIRPIVALEDALDVGIIPVGPKGKSRRKDTRAWCRGVEGHDHVPQIVYRTGVSTLAQIEKACGWGWSYDKDEFKTWYRCGHVESCANCGKVLRSRQGWQSHAFQLGDKACPRYYVLSKTQVAALREAWEAWRAEYAERMVKYQLRKARKAIAGPSHYRKK